MPTFTWEGQTRTGETRQGTMDANDIEAVRNRLRQQEIKLISAKKKAKQIDFVIGNPIKQKDIVIFTRQFATMIDSGLPLVRCLDILGTQSPNKYFQKTIFDIKESVEGGATFADSLKKHPKVFDNLFTNLVAAGEVGGILDHILKRLAQYIEKSQALKRKVKGAMFYPAGITAVAMIVLIVLLYFVIPKFKDMFDDLSGKGLPAPTEMVIAMSNWMQDNIVMVLIAIAIFIFSFKTFLKWPKGRDLWDAFVLKTPLFGSLVIKVSVAKFTSTLGMMLSSGVPILEALDIVAKTAGNRSVEKALLYTKDRISEGRSITEPLMETKIFPPMVVQMISVGEQTGAMENMLDKIAQFYEEEVDQTVETITSLIEPVMMVVLGGMVGFMLIAMYLPIFELAKSVG